MAMTVSSEFFGSAPEAKRDPKGAAREALLALGLYVGAQVFVVVTSYLLSMDLALPWVPKPRAMRLSIGSVYSSYLDQSIMTAGLAAVQERSGSPVAVIGYSSTVAFGHVLISMSGTALVWMLHR